MFKTLLIGITFFMFLAIIKYPGAHSTTVKDRFNLYKDIVHLKDDNVPELVEPLVEEKEYKPNYFYKIPTMGFNSDSIIRQLPTDLGKRTNNRYKNYMMEKDISDVIHKSGLGSLYELFSPNRDVLNQD